MFDEAISLLSIWASMNTWLTPTVLFLLLNLMIGTIVLTSGFTSYKPHHHNHHDTTVNHHNHHHQPPPPQLTRASSVLQRLKSINFYSYYSHTPSSTTLLHQQIPPEVHVPQPLQNSPLVSDPFTKLKPEHPVRVSLTEAETRTRDLDEETISQTRAPVIEVVRGNSRTSHREGLLQKGDTIDEDGPTLDEIYSRIKGSSSSLHYNRQKSDTKPTGGEIPIKLPAKIKKSASDKSAFNHFQVVEEAETVAPAVVEEAKVAAAAATGGCEVDARADDFINRFKKQLQLQKMESIVRYKEMITSGSEQ